MKRTWLHVGSVAVMAGTFTASLSVTPSFAKANPYAQPETISIAFPGTGSAGYEISPNDKMLHLLESKFNVTFKFVTETWSNYNQEATLWAASGQLPDIFFSDNYYNATTLNQWIKQGVINPLPTNLSQYPYLQKIANRGDVKAIKINGKFYYWPMLLSTSTVLNGDRGIFVRRDWMNKLRLSNQPKSWTDLVTTLKTLVKDNPEHSSNVVGITANNENFVTDLFTNELPYHGWWEKQNGRWIPGWTSSAEPTMLNQLHSLYTQGLLDKDYSNSNNPYDTKFVDGQAAAIVYQPKNIMNLEKVWNQAHPKENFSSYVEPLIMPPAPNGNRYSFQFNDWYGGEFISSSVDQTKEQRIMAIFNYLASPAGRELSNFGIEGTDWKMAGGKIKSLHPASWVDTNTYDSAGVWQFLSVWAYAGPNYVEFKTANPVPAGWDPSTFNMVQKYYAWCLKNQKAAPINWVVNAYSYTLPPVTATTGDWLSQAVASSNPTQVWRKAVNTWMNGGGAKEIDEVTGKYKNQGN